MKIIVATIFLGVLGAFFVSSLELGSSEREIEAVLIPLSEAPREVDFSQITQANAVDSFGDQEGPRVSKVAPVPEKKVEVAPNFVKPSEKAGSVELEPSTEIVKSKIEKGVASPKNPESTEAPKAISPEYILALEAQAREEIKKPKFPIVAGAPKVVAEAVAETGTGEVVGETTLQSSTLLIVEVQITGGTGKTKEDYVQIYNFGTESINLADFRLVKRTKTGTKDTSLKAFSDEDVIEPQDFFVWANSDYVGQRSPNVTTSGTLSNDNGVAIRRGKNDEGEIIDSVAWGEAENIFIEGSVFPENPGEGEILKRQENQDTDNNAANFSLESTLF